MNYMVQNSDGKWVTGPSSSPENIYITAKNQYGCLCMGPTMDIEIVRELFSNYLKTVEIFGKRGTINRAGKRPDRKSAEIKSWKIWSDSGVGSGLRRIGSGTPSYFTVVCFVSCTADPERPDSKLAQAAEKNWIDVWKMAEVIQDGVKRGLSCFLQDCGRRKKHIKIFKNYWQRQL